MERLTEKDKEYYRIAEPYINWTNGVQRVVKKLGQLEDIEQEIGVSLSALFKQPYCTIFVKKDYGENYKNVIEEHTLYSIIPQEKCIIVTFENIKFYWKDYGKTWALTKEELEKYDKKEE